MANLRNNHRKQITSSLLMQHVRHQNATISQTVISKDCLMLIRRMCLKMRNCFQMNLFSTCWENRTSITKASSILSSASASMYRLDCPRDDLSAQLWVIHRFCVPTELLSKHSTCICFLKCMNSVTLLLKLSFYLAIWWFLIFSMFAMNRGCNHFIIYGIEGFHRSSFFFILMNLFEIWHMMYIVNILQHLVKSLADCSVNYYPTLLKL